MTDRHARVAAVLERLRSEGILVALRGDALDVEFPDDLTPAARDQLVAIFQELGHVVAAALRREERDAVAAAERLLAPGAV